MYFINRCKAIHHVTNHNICLLHVAVIIKLLKYLELAILVYVDRFPGKLFSHNVLMVLYHLYMSKVITGRLIDIFGLLTPY